MSSKTMTPWMTAALSGVLLLMPASLPHSQQPANILTPVCQAPDGEIASEAPLRHLPAVLQTPTRPRVLAIGSSSTAGIGATSPYNTYPAQLEAILERLLKNVDLEMFNRGVSGEIATATAERLKQEVERLGPHLVLWQVGTNDALRGVPVEAIEATIRDTVQWVKEHNADIVLVGLQYTPRFARDEHYTRVRNALSRVAASENVLLVRRFDAMAFIARTQANIDYLSGDQFHLNDVGYHCMAEHIAQALVTNVFLRRRDVAFGW
ncbi:MAG TPA: GDSL-type esterase/lipase family protein [Beijerinckiaceae bacterium]|nr:GDSL-type esterase/lipase family protein [Beijerinckiaceae bacterium]